MTEQKLEEQTVSQVRFQVLNVETQVEEEVVYLETDFQIMDWAKEATENAAKMAYWNRLYADASYQLAMEDAAYRKWRGASLTKLLEKDPRLSEWKAMAEIEGTEEFLQMKERIADADRASQLCKGAFETYAAKGRMLEAHLRREAAEWTAAGRIGMEGPDGEMQAKVKALKEIFKKKGE